MGKSRLNSRLFYQYMVSYLVMLMLPMLVIGIAAYHYIIQLMRDEAIRSNLTVLSQAKDTIEMKMNELGNIAVHIASNPHLSPYTATKNAFNEMNAIAELRNYASANYFIHDMLLYFRGRSELYSPYSVFSAKSYTEHIFRYEHWSADSFYRDLNTLETPLLRPAEEVRVPDPEKFITYLVPIPYRETSPYGTVVFQIKASTVNDMIVTTFGDYGGNAVILNERGEPITSLSPISGESLERLAEMAGEQGGTGSGTIHLEGNDYFAGYAKADASGWTYVSLVDQSAVMKPVELVKTRTLYSLLLALLLGSVAIYGLMSLNYAPILRLKQFVDNRLGRAFRDSNELESIRSAVRYMSDHNHELNRRLAGSRPAIRTFLLTALLKGEFQHLGQFNAKAGEADLSFTVTRLRVVLFVFSRKDDARRPSGDALLREIESRFAAVPASFDIVETTGIAESDETAKTAETAEFVKVGATTANVGTAEPVESAKAAGIDKTAGIAEPVESAESAENAGTVEPVGTDKAAEMDGTTRTTRTTGTAGAAGAVGTVAAALPGTSEEMLLTASGGVSGPARRLVEGIEGYGLESLDGNMLIFIVGDGGDDRPLRGKLAEIQRELVEKRGLQTTIGVGNSYADATELGKSYLEASGAVDYRLIHGHGKIIWFSELDMRHSAFAGGHPGSDWNRLRLSIVQGDAAQIEKQLDGIIAAIRADGTPLFSARCMCFDLIHVIFSVTAEMKHSPGDRQGQYPDVLSLTEFETVEELIELVRTISADLCAIIREQKESANFELRDRIVDYIGRHYASYQFSVQAMADELQVSASYLSRYFKDQTGQTVMNHVHTVRMEKAKQLLREGTDNMQQLAGQIGFASAPGFIRRFKETEGVTPGEYRAMHAAKPPGIGEPV